MLRWRTIAALLAVAALAGAGTARAERNPWGGDIGAREADQIAAAAARSPRDPVLRYRLGVAMRGLGDHRAAIDQFRLAAAYAAKGSLMQGQALWGIALSYEELGRCADAARAWRRYLATSGGDIPEHRAIARRHLEQCPSWPVNAAPERFPRF